MPPAFDAPFEDDDSESVDKQSARESSWLSDTPDWSLLSKDYQRGIAEAAESELDISLLWSQVGDQQADGLEDADAHGQNRKDVAGVQKQVDGLDDLEDIDDEVTDDQADPEDSPASADSVIAESVHESVEAADQWVFERTLEFVADAIHPGAGRLINIAFTIKEMLGDAEALASPDSPRNLHVPLLHVTGGLTVDLNVHLPASDGSQDNSPPLGGFLAPSDDGLFGGWEIETERHEDPDEQEAPRSAQDAATEVAEQTQVSSVIEDDLYLARWRVKDRWRRAVLLREAASLLRTRLYARPEFAAEPILVICDPLTGLGIWLVNPALVGGVAERRIVIWLGLATGMMRVFVE